MSSASGRWRAGVVALGLSAVAAASSPAFVPGWSAPIPDPSKPLAGLRQVAGYDAMRVYKATPELGLYNHAAMIGFHDGQMLVTWKNGVTGEDQPAQRVMMAQSTDGKTWTPSDGSNIAFPNMSTTANPAHLFAGPPIVLNGHVYASASPIQFCLFPDQYQPVLLLRRVFTNATRTVGDAFWASDDVPSGFEEASRIHSIRTLRTIDPEAREDAALLTPAAKTLPCAADLAHDHTTKCEACVGGCQPWPAAQKLDLANERTRFSAGSTDVLLYRSRKERLFASTRQAGGGWSDIVETLIPDIDSNINSGRLPDGRTYLVSNAVPGAAIRNPLTIATSRNGTSFETVASAISCEVLAPGGNATDPCKPAYPGRAKSGGPQYPQAAVVQGARGFEDGLYIVISNNKEDIWVVRLPLGNI